MSISDEEGFGTSLGDLVTPQNVFSANVPVAGQVLSFQFGNFEWIDNAVSGIIILQGNWDASINVPILTSGSFPVGHAWRVSTSGSTNLGGITNWSVNDLAIVVESGSGWIQIGGEITGDVWGNISGSIVDQTDLYNGLLAKEEVSNKATSPSLGSSDALYPSQKAVKTYVDLHINSAGSSVHNLGTMSIQNSDSVNITSGSISGSFIGGINIIGTGISDNYATTPIKLADASNTSLSTDNKTIIGSTNEIYNALSYLSAGVTGSSAVLTDANNGSATISSVDVLLYDNANFVNEIRKFTVSGSSFVFTDGVEEYVAIKYNSGSPIMYKETTWSVINNSNIIPLFTCWRQGNTIHSLGFDALGNGLSNKAQNAMYNTELYKISTSGGLVISETTSPNPRTITVTGGIVYTGAISQTVGAFNSSNDTMTFTYHSSGSWLYNNTLVYNNSQYDNGTNLASLNSNKFGVFWFYRSIGDVKQVFYVAGSAEYTKKSDAELALPRNDLNTLLRSHCMLIGRAIVQQGVASGDTQSAFGIMFTGTNVINHNDTNNIQGGDSGSGQYYHATSTEYSNLQSLKTMAYQNGSSVTITGGSISNTSMSGSFTGNLTGNIIGNSSGSSTLNVLKSGDTMSGALTISGSNSTYVLDIAQVGSGSIMRIGTSTDNTSFEKDGTLLMTGSATVWNDVAPTSLINARVGGGNQPTLTAIQGNIQALTFIIGDYVYGSFELLHEYKEGTVIDVHIHWANQTLDASDRGVNWEFEYTISNLNMTTPYANAFPTSTTLTKETLIPANSTAKSHIYTDIGSISGTGIKIGTYILWRLRRIASVTTPTGPSASPYAFAVGAHIEQDSLGSRIEHTKQ